MANDSKVKLVPSSSKESEKSDISALKSVIDSAEPLDCFKPASSRQALDIAWCFGLNSSLPVHNISHGTRRAVFYVAGHTGVLLNLEENRQCSLKCHSHPIACTAVSKDRRWLVTADVGRDCCLTVWDSFSGVPVKTVYQGLGKGTVAVAFSSDAKYMASVSAGPEQCIAIWDWTIEGESPSVCVSLDPHLDKQEHVVFCEEDSHQLMTSGDEQVVFYHWKGDSLLHYTPTLSDKDFNKTLGLLSGCSFLPGTATAVSTTSEGSAVVWEVEQQAMSGLEKGRKALLEPHIRKPLKLMKLHTSPITAVTTVDSYLVTGDSVGDVKFFDSDLKLINWFDSLKHGPIASLSFGFLPKAMRPSLDGKKTTIPPKSTQCTIEGKPFSAADFVISTTNACLAYVDIATISSQLIFSEHDAAINALATHPKEPRLLIGSYSCRLKLWNYEKRQIAAVRTLGEQDFIQCVAFDPAGSFVGIGCTNGVLYMVDAITLHDVCEPFVFSKDCITHIAFSQDSRFLATADLDYCVTVYVLQAREEGDVMWTYLGRQRPHYKPITGLRFGASVTGGVPRLLSLSQDRTLVEYDLANSSQDDLQLLAADRIEQSAIPLTLEWYPSLSKEPFIMTANDQYKLKLYNATTKMCRKTLLGPLYGSPLRKMLVLPCPVLRSEAGEEVRRYLVYITKDKVGLMLLPHDGNPHNSVAFIAHPRQVTEVVCSFDGRHLFTSGGEDCVVNMWTVNTDALEASSKLGGEGLDPFYSMLDGGRDGEFFAELEDYFYYAQIMSQGPSTVDRRQVSATIPLDKVPSVMRAIGYYPTEQEVEDMMNEVKFSQYVDTGKYVSFIGLGDFIKLYVNHRPAFGLSPRELIDAFRTLGSRAESMAWAISRPDLLSLLQKCGEGFVDAELLEHLMVLLGYSSDPELEGSFTEDPEMALDDSLPKSITASKFANDVLGFQL